MLFPFSLLFILFVLFDMTSVLVDSHQSISQPLTGSQVFPWGCGGILLGIDLFVPEYRKPLALGHVFFGRFVLGIFRCGLLDFALFNQSFVLFRDGADNRALDAGGVLILVLDVCLELLVNGWITRTVRVHSLTNSDGHAVLPDPSTRDTLVDERARCTERAKHALLPASVAGRDGGAIAARATK
jgi:hypothetical protein